MNDNFKTSKFTNHFENIMNKISKKNVHIVFFIDVLKPVHDSLRL